MARDKRPQPSWLGNATKRVDDFAEELRSDIKAVAIRIAKHERAERVLEKHVDQAWQLLVRVGLRLQPTWKRPETEVGLGSFVLGAAMSIPDLVGVFASEQNTAFAWNTALVSGTVLVGLGLVAHGWIRARV